MSGWLPPGVTDKDIDDAANGDPADFVQCDNCQKMFDPEDPDQEDCFIGWTVHGDTAQCAECIQAVRANFPFSGSFQ